MVLLTSQIFWKNSLQMGTSPIVKLRWCSIKKNNIVNNSRKQIKTQRKFAFALHIKEKRKLWKASKKSQNKQDYTSLKSALMKQSMKPRKTKNRQVCKSRIFLRLQNKFVRTSGTKVTAVQKIMMGSCVLQMVQRKELGKSTMTT